MTTKVVISNRWVDPDGNTHEGGDTVDLEAGVARDLIARGKARVPDAETTAPSAGSDAEETSEPTTDQATAALAAGTEAADPTPDSAPVETAPTPDPAPAETASTSKPAARRAEKKEVAK